VLSRPRSRQRAQAIVWVVVMLPIFLGIAGLSIDAGRMFDARREAQNIADGAARVAAMQIDTNALHQSRDSLRLNQNAASVAAIRYITDQESGSGWNPPEVHPDGNGVTVVVSRQLSTTFMRILSPKSTVTVSASSRAEPCVGVITGRTISGGQC
jgi:uncharacterized membrane protein